MEELVMKGIFWAVLHQNTAEFLKSKALFETIHAHHITLRFDVEYEEMSEWEGIRVPFLLTEIAWDAQIQAARVELLSDVPCGNRNPHVTISAKEGVSPVKSNDVLAEATYTREEVLPHQFGWAHVEFFSFDK